MRWLCFLCLVMIAVSAHAQGYDDIFADDYGIQGSSNNLLDDGIGAQAQTCMDHCLSRGNMVHVCEQRCELPEDPIDDWVDDTVDTEEEFDDVNFDCFKRCRLEGDSFDTCELMCSR